MCFLCEGGYCVFLPSILHTPSPLPVVLNRKHVAVCGISSLSFQHLGGKHEDCHKFKASLNRHLPVWPSANYLSGSTYKNLGRSLSQVREKMPQKGDGDVARPSMVVCASHSSYLGGLSRRPACTQEAGPSLGNIVRTPSPHLHPSHRV